MTADASALDSALADLRRSFERFVPIPDDAWADIRRPWALRRFEKGEMLTREGQTERRFSLVVEGTQRLFFTTDDGAEHTVAFVYPPDYSGVPDSFFLQRPSAFGLEALSDGWQLSIGHERFAALMDRHRALDRWAWRLLAHAMVGRFQREREILTMPAQARYRRLLRESPHVLQLAALRHVASYLGMTPETLSRVRAAS
jgi:CRP-like cAMP-binding protein